MKNKNKISREEWKEEETVCGRRNKCRKNWGEKSEKTQNLGKVLLFHFPKGACFCSAYVYSSQVKQNIWPLFPVSVSQASSLSATCIISRGSANCRLGSPLDVKVRSAHEAALVVLKLGFFSTHSSSCSLLILPRPPTGVCRPALATNNNPGAPRRV